MILGAKQSEHRSDVIMEYVTFHVIGLKGPFNPCRSVFIMHTCYSTKPNEMESDAAVSYIYIYIFF